MDATADMQLTGNDSSENWMRVKEKEGDGWGSQGNRTAACVVVMITYKQKNVFLLPCK